MRSARRRTASKTFTVPTTFTAAPNGGFPRTNGTCSAARWTPAPISQRSSICSTRARSVTSPVSTVRRARSAAGTASSMRSVPRPTSRPTTGSPSSSSALIVQAPMQPLAPVTKTASAKRRVLVDGDLLRVELHRRPPLLVRAPAGALDAAERHVHVGAGGLRVHVQDPGLQLLREALYGAEVAREDRRREPELDAVRTSQRLVQGREAVERGDGAEDLLAREQRLVGDVLEDRRQQEIRLVVGSLAPGDHGAALPAPGLDRLEDVAELGFVHDRADLGCGIGRIADDALLDAREKARAEVVVDGVVDLDAESRRALVPGRPEPPA